MKVNQLILPASGTARMRSARGFSMVELLVTIVLAGIIFAAMVPVFAGALKVTARDANRVTATNFAQDRIEKIRMLPYDDIWDSNLNDPNYAGGQAGGQFLTSWTPVGGKTYTVAYKVDDNTVPDAVTGIPKSTYRKIKVTVSWSGSGSPLIVNTIVTNPAAVTTGTTPTPSATPSPHSTTGTNYTLRVSVTDDDVDHTKGVTVVRTDSGYNQTQSPAKQVPDATNGLTVSWTGLVGGPDVTYLVTVTFTPPGYSKMSLTRIVTMVGSTPIYFDTNPNQ